MNFRGRKVLLSPSLLYYRSCLLDDKLSNRHMACFLPPNLRSDTHERLGHNWRGIERDYCEFMVNKHSIRQKASFLQPKFTSYSHERFQHNLSRTERVCCEFQNIILTGYAPSRNFHAERNPLASTQYDGGCINSRSCTETQAMQGSDNLKRGSDTSTTEYAVMIQNLLKVHHDPIELKSALDQCRLLLTEDLVLEVLQRHQSDWSRALFFFNWGFGQQDYSHGSRAYNEMLDILGRMKRFELMKKLVDGIPQEKRISLVTDRTFAILLNRYASGHKVEEAIEMFYRRVEFGLKLDNTAFQTLLMSLCRYKHVEAAESFFLLKQDEFPPDIKSRNIILNGWCVLGNLREAKRFWNDIITSRCKPDLYTYGTFINSLTKAGKLSRAVDLFSAMWKKGCAPDVAICNCIIDALCFKKRIPDALTIFSEMNERGCLPDVATYNSLIKHLCNIRRMEKAYELLDEMEQKGCIPNTRTYGYFFKSMKKPEEVPLMLERMERNGCRMMADTYNLILKLFIGWNDQERVQSIWGEMEKNGMGPDQRSYTIMIHGLYSKGNMDETLQYFNEMTSKGMTPEPRTRLLVKAIELKRAENANALSSNVEEKRKKKKKIAR
ncbi:putative pentatricopeptide repeat-containing protein [Cinnamomum micranthum f. kanehirae]|uniref:Putative pentatricopeptide repeat-containing protein n=1 Tax=Cinnamomum micranthum f. kanehirae TaxID=337451 RepID=A0A3S3QLQ4_9MAGN|nr:putative pentatricopeptide repeat-containing protein [Cinnamomum micranthum f. kanehirae]